MRNINRDQPADSKGRKKESHLKKGKNKTKQDSAFPPIPSRDLDRNEGQERSQKI